VGIGGMYHHELSLWSVVLSEKQIVFVLVKNFSLSQINLDHAIPSKFLKVGECTHPSED
jgi:hypothetical protein